MMRETRDVLPLRNSRLAEFQAPPSSGSQIPFWFLNGPVDGREWARQIEEMASHGVSTRYMLLPRTCLSTATPGTCGVPGAPDAHWIPVFWDLSVWRGLERSGYNLIEATFQKKFAIGWVELDINPSADDGET